MNDERLAPLAVLALASTEGWDPIERDIRVIRAALTAALAALDGPEPLDDELVTALGSPDVEALVSWFRRVNA